MIKNLAYFGSQCALNSAPILAAFLNGAQRQGIECCADSWHADAAVIWSVLWHGRMRLNQKVYQHYRDLGRPVIIIEVGNFGRNRTWRVSVNHVTSQGWYGHQQNLDPDRPKKLGIQLESPGPAASHVLLALQHRRSLQVQDLGNMSQWLLTMLHKIRQYTDRPVLVRPHPRDLWQLPPLPGNAVLQRPSAVANTYDDFDISYACHAVVNYNSGPGVQAACAGTRPIVHDTSLAWPVSVALEHIEQPYNQDRHQWLIEMAHTEYTVEELRQGSWLKRLGPALEL